MGLLDAPMRRLASSLVPDFGADATLKRESGEYDPDTRTRASTTTSYSVTGILESYDERLVDGDRVQLGDQRFTIPAKGLTITPTTDDELTVDGNTYAIVRVESVYSGDQVALYRLHLRL